MITRLTAPCFALALALPAADAAELDRGKLIAQLVQHEGKKAKAYKDTAGHPTIGVGFNLDRADAKKKIEALGLNFEKVKAGAQELTDQQITRLLDADIEAAMAECKAVFPGFSDLSDVRQRVLADMMFNIGRTKAEQFQKLIAAVAAKDFGKAADEMKNSAWYRQVGMRGRELEQMMRTDTDPKK
ncbi:MAG TPA: glycoside hydrolase family protein [Urbifossiella sp.]|nr:glycoside hydrolase family protein [Urbifossiella sp.]